MREIAIFYLLRPSAPRRTASLVSLYDSGQYYVSTQLGFVIFFAINTIGSPRAQFLLSPAYFFSTEKFFRACIFLITLLGGHDDVGMSRLPVSFVFFSPGIWPASAQTTLESEPPEVPQVFRCGMGTGIEAPRPAGTVRIRRVK